MVCTGTSTAKQNKTKNKKQKTKNKKQKTKIGKSTELRNIPKDQCDMVRLDSTVSLHDMFHGQLSKTWNGFVEPLLTPMRHPMYCFDRE
jgi:hypothetical protein